MANSRHPVLEHAVVDKNNEMRVNYVIITPVRDEEQYFEKTIVSVASQTILPTQWIIVNDGSKDRTGEIIDNYSKKYSWIIPVHRKDRGFRKNGSGVMEAFYEGYEKTNTHFDFLVKLDGDLSFESNYFEKCFEKFAQNEKLGIGGGVITSLNGNQKVFEKDVRFHVRGATKIYKRDCWESIGQLVIAPGWDTLDEIKANMNSWHTETFFDIPLTQHKITGGADGNWKNSVKNGKANFISGYHPLFMLMKCIKRLPRKPIVIGALGLFWGYLTGYIFKIPRVDDSALIRYIRKEQINRLLLKKSIWKD